MTLIAGRGFFFSVFLSAPQMRMIVGCFHAFIIGRGNRWEYPIQRGMMFKQMTNEKYNRPHNAVALGGEMPLSELSAALKCALLTCELCN